MQSMTIFVRKCQASIMQTAWYDWNYIKSTEKSPESQYFKSLQKYLIL